MSLLLKWKQEFFSVCGWSLCGEDLGKGVLAWWSVNILVTSRWSWDVTQCGMRAPVWILPQEMYLWPTDAAELWQGQDWTVLPQVQACHGVWVDKTLMLHMFLSSPSSVLELGISLVVQWLRTLHAMQGTQVQSLVGELRSHLPQNSSAHVLQLVEPLSYNNEPLSRDWRVGTLQQKIPPVQWRSHVLRLRPDAAEWRLGACAARVKRAAVPPTVPQLWGQLVWVYR